MKLISIGNSIVNGFPHTRDRSFSSVLSDMTGWTVINKGINGQSSQEILDRFDADVVSQAPDTVLILTGTNDFIFTGDQPEQVQSNLAAMAEKAVQADIVPVLATPLLADEQQAAVCWMPELNIDYRKVNDRLKALASLIRDYCSDRGLKCIDTQTGYSAYARYCDGIHPTAEGQRLLAEIIMKELK